MIPPFNQIDTLSRESDEPATVNYLSRNSNNILSVGRIVPNKGFEYMIKALASLNMTQTDKAHLHLVGSQDPRLLEYINHLKSLATELSLQNQVTFHPRVGSAALATYYRYSDVYFTASQHEGFCVPVVEAMAFGLPIVCSSAGALPETGGPCAIYADDPVSMSKALASILYSDSVRFQKRELSLSFYRNNFRHKIIQEKFVKMIRNLDLPAQSNLYRGDKNPTKEDENAFGLPAFHIYVDRYCRNEPIHEYRLRSQAYRKQLALETILKVKDDDLLSFLKSDRVLRYIESLDVPSAAAYINPIARLLWHLSSSARSRYSLSSEESVADFLAWFWRLTCQNSTLDSFLSFREKKRLNDLLD